MQYTIKIVETLVREVTVHAESAYKAAQQVREDWQDGSIILDDSDFCDVEFHTL